MICPFISGSSLVSRHSSHSSLQYIQLSITLCREPLRTVYLVHLDLGHNVLKPGNLGAKSSSNFLNSASRFGESFNSFEIPEVVSRGSLRFLTSLIMSPTGSCKECLKQWLKVALGSSALIWVNSESFLQLWQERSFLGNGENTKFGFEWLITCLQTRKKGN